MLVSDNQIHTGSVHLGTEQPQETNRTRNHGQNTMNPHRTERQTLKEKKPTNRHPWEFPDCPECSSHLFVGFSPQGTGWVCHRCSDKFSQSDLPMILLGAD